MSDAFSGITFRVIQEMMPEYHLPDDLLNGVMAALLLPRADVTAARRRGRPARIIEEISWRGAGRVSARLPAMAPSGRRPMLDGVTVEQGDSWSLEVWPVGLPRMRDLAMSRPAPRVRRRPRIGELQDGNMAGRVHPGDRRRVGKPLRHPRLSSRTASFARKAMGAQEHTHPMIEAVILGVASVHHGPASR
jgi:hypothetical protein